MRNSKPRFGGWLLGADEDLTLDNAKAILKDVELGTLTVNTKGEYTFELPPDGSAGSILVDTLQQGTQSGRPSTIPSPTRTAAFTMAALTLSSKAPTTGPN